MEKKTPEYWVLATPLEKKPNKQMKRESWLDRGTNWRNRELAACGEVNLNRKLQIKCWSQTKVKQWNSKVSAWKSSSAPENKAFFPGTLPISETPQPEPPHSAANHHGPTWQENSCGGPFPSSPHTKLPSFATKCPLGDIETHTW